jgi:hypothetical protein
MQLKKGARVEVVVFNHPPYATGFMSKKFEMPMIELLYVIYPKYGDTIRMIPKPTNIVEKVAAPSKPAQPVVAATSVPTTQINATPELVNAITAAVIAQLQSKAVAKDTEVRQSIADAINTDAIRKGLPSPKVTAAATVTVEEEIDSQVISGLYDDMDADIAEAEMPEVDTQSLAAVNPWK